MITDEKNEKNNAAHKFETNLAEGSVAKKLIVFAIPFIISNIVQSLYNVADMVIVGQFCGTASMSGVNIGGQVTLLMTNLVVGLSAGATVLIGQYLGSGSRKELKETVATLFTTLAIAAVVISALTVSLRAPILKLIQTPAESFGEAKDYLLITTLGAIFIFGYNAFSAVMRGMGDSVRPLFFVSAACVTNIVLDIIFVGPLKMGAAGAALATIISQALSMFLCIFFFIKNNFLFDFKLRSFRIHGDRLKMLLKIGVPTSIQNVVVNISFLMLTTMVNTLGVTESAAVGAVGKFNSFAILPAIAISSSVSAMCAQNIGAGEYGRAVKTMKIGLGMAFSLSFMIFVVAQLFPEPILRMFGDDTDMIAAGATYIRSFSFDYIFAPLTFSLNGLFIGAGHTAFSLVNGMMSSLLIRVPVAFILGIAMNWGLMGVGLGAPFASFVSLIICTAYFISGRWRKSVILHREPNL